MRVMLIQLGFVSGHREIKWTNGTQAGLQRAITDCCATHFPPCLHHNIPDQAVEPEGRSLFQASRLQDYSWTRRGGLSVYLIDALCSDAVKVDQNALENCAYGHKKLYLQSVVWFFLLRNRGTFNDEHNTLNSVSRKAMTLQKCDWSAALFCPRATSVVMLAVQRRHVRSIHSSGTGSRQIELLLKEHQAGEQWKKDVISQNKSWHLTLMWLFRKKRH